MIIQTPRVSTNAASAVRLAIANRLPLPTSMAGGAFGGGIVEHYQAVDRDARFGIDQKWVDVDRSDARAGIRHQIGYSDERLHGGSLVQRRLAAIALQLHAGFGLINSCF